MTREEALAWRPDAEDEAFCAVYGDWDPLTPTELRDLMAGYPEPWWVVGGWSVEAFTGVPRFHEDIDLVVYVEHVPQLREQLGGLFHLWSNAGGTFRLIDDRSPEPIEPLSQIWMREDARSPWRVDCILNGSVGGRWQSKRDASCQAAPRQGPHRPRRRVAAARRRAPGLAARVGASAAPGPPLAGTARRLR